MNHLFYFLLLFFLNFSVFSQNKKPVWKAVFQYKKIYTDKEKASIDSLVKNDALFRDMQDFANNNMHYKTFVMYFDNQVSKFNQKYIDKDPRAAEFLNQLNKDFYLFKSLKTGKYIQNQRLPDFTVTDSLPDFHWHITGEQKKIGKYTVIKATGHETRTVRTNNKIKDIDLDITAWFCPDIPVPNGPELYGGLPGFIMEVSTGKDFFLLKELSFKPNGKTSIKPPQILDKKGTYKEFLIEQDRHIKESIKRFKNRRGKQKDWWQN